MDNAANKKFPFASVINSDTLDDTIYEDVERLGSILYALSSLFGSEDFTEKRVIEVSKVRPLLTIATNSMNNLTQNLDERLIKDNLGINKLS